MSKEIIEKVKLNFVTLTVCKMFHQNWSVDAIM